MTSRKTGANDPCEHARPELQELFLIQVAAAQKPER